MANSQSSKGDKSPKLPCVAPEDGGAKSSTPAPAAATSGATTASATAPDAPDTRPKANDPNKPPPPSANWEGTAFAAKKDEGMWRCSLCLVENDKERKKCASCKPDVGEGTCGGGGGGACDEKEGEKKEESKAAGMIGANGFSFGAASSTSAPAPGAIGAGESSFGTTTSTRNAAPAPGFTFGSAPAPVAVAESSERGKSLLSGGFNFGAPAAATDDKSANSTNTAGVPHTPFTSPISPNSRDRCCDPFVLLDETFLQTIVNHWDSGHYFHDYSKFLIEYRNQALALQGGKIRQPNKTEEDEFYKAQLPIPYFTPCASVVQGLPKELGEELAAHVNTEEFESKARKSSFRFARLKTATKNIYDSGVEVANPKPSQKRGRSKDEGGVVEDSLNSPMKESTKKKAKH